MNYLIALLGLALLLAGCKGDVTKLNDENPYYQKGVQLMEESRYDEAVIAFQQCLRYSPKSHKAHLQLAILFEDNLLDFPQAIAHYELYIKGEPDAAKRQKAQVFQERAEEGYYLQLHQRFSNLTTPAQSTSPALPTSPAQPTLPPPPISLPEAAPEPMPPTIAKPKPDKAVTLPAPVPASPTPIVQEEPEKAPRMYTVEAGDNLSKIARKFYGSTTRWREIFEANRATLRSPDQLKVGQELIIPE